MRYKGPAKPVPTHIELISDKVERIVVLCCLIVLALDLLYWRPY
jgi:hypothetical protein